MMPGRLDHLVFAVPDFDAGVDAVARRFGVSPTPGGSHPAWGTRNALVTLGERAYLEIVGPDVGRHDDRPALFGIDRLAAPRLVTWAARSSALEDTVERAATVGLDLGAVQDGRRATRDGRVLTWRLTNPFAERAGGVVPFLIDWGTSPHPASSAAPGCRLVACRAEHPDAERVRRWLDALGLDLRVALGSHPRLTATIETPRGRLELV